MWGSMGMRDCTPLRRVECILHTAIWLRWTQDVKRVGSGCSVRQKFFPCSASFRGGSAGTNDPGPALLAPGSSETQVSALYEPLVK